jgi:hypothetical protein
MSRSFLEVTRFERAMLRERTRGWFGSCPPRRTSAESRPKLARLNDGPRSLGWTPAAIKRTDDAAPLFSIIRIKRRIAAIALACTGLSGFQAERLSRAQKRRLSHSRSARISTKVRPKYRGSSCRRSHRALCSPNESLLTTGEGLFAGRLSDSREGVKVLDVAVVVKLWPVANN